jgi:hypothetical protein
MLTPDGGNFKLLIVIYTAMCERIKSQMNFIRTIACLCLTVFVGIGCDTVKDVASKDETLKSIRKEAKEFLGDTELSLEEVKKLKQVEYHIEAIALEDDATAMAAKLSALGKKRWTCFHIEKQLSSTGEEQLLVFCRRPVYTPLRYVPGSVIGR